MPAPVSRILIALAPALGACAEPPLPAAPPLHTAGPILWAADAARVLEGRRSPPDEHAGHGLDGGRSWFARADGAPHQPDILVGGGSKYEPDPSSHIEKRDTALVFDGRSRQRLETEPAQRFQGGRGGEHFAHAVAFAGDLAGRGDGRSDVAFGAPRARPADGTPEAVFTEAGRVVVYFADDAAVERRADVLHRADAGVVVDGVEPGLRVGWSLVGPGDLDGDGIDDLVVGAPGSSATADRPGRVYLISGAGLAAFRREVGGPLEIPLDHPRLAARIVEGTHPGDRFGYAVAAAGDLDGDGRPDLVVGAPQFSDAGEPSGAGYVSLLYGPASPDEPIRRRDLPGEQFGSRFGCAVAGSVDLSGDGHPDVAVGASRYATGGALELGRVYVFDPRAEPESRSWLHVVTGEESGGKLGHAVELLPSIDGDERGELVVGAPDASPDPSLIDPGPGETGDASGADGEPSPPGGPAAGKAFVFLGGTGPAGGRPELLYQVWGEQPRDHCGWSLAAAGDLDGNGVDDLLVGALAHPFEPADERGRVYVLLHPDRAAR